MNTDQRQPTATILSVAIPTTPIALPNLGELLGNFPITFTPEQLTQLAQRLSQVNFDTITKAEIGKLGSSAEESLHRTLDDYLKNIDQIEHPRLFALLEALSEDVEKEKLDQLADRIINGKVGLGTRLVSMVSKKAMKRAQDDLIDETRRLLSDKTRNLSETINRKELELNREMVKVEATVHALDHLMPQYRDRFIEMATEVAFASAFAQIARLNLMEREQTVSPTDILAQSELDGLKDKLEGLESRALALNGQMTRLPAETLVARTLQNAGLQTLQEITTNARGRFASIKQTLISLHVSLQIRDVQRLDQQGARLDESLNRVRGKLLTQVVNTAANAPGDNRLKQAQEVKKIVEDTNKLRIVVKTAQQANLGKFEQARTIFAEARNAMLALGKPQQ